MAATAVSTVVVLGGAGVAGATGSAAGGGASPTYPVPPPPPHAPTAPPTAPPVLARTGSDSAAITGIGAGTLAVGGGFVLLARRRRLALHVN